MRLGHEGLQQHMYRFRMSEYDRCECLEDEESVEHYLLNCRLHIEQRCTLLKSLRKINVKPTLKNLLGGGDFPENKQMNIADIVIKFITDTKNIKTL